MKVQKVTLQNFRGAPNGEYNLDGKSVWLFGDNATGKTSFLESIWEPLTKIESNPITKGQKEGSVKIDMGDGGTDCTLEWKYTDDDKQKSFKLKFPPSVDHPKGKTVTSKGELMSMVGDISFDPFDFIRLEKKKQVEMVKKFFGLDFSDLDSKYDKDFNARKLVNQTIENLKGVLAESGFTSATMKLYKEKKDDADVKAKMKENETDINTRQELIKQAQGLENDIDNHGKRVIFIGEEIERLEAQIQKYREEETQLQITIEETSVAAIENGKEIQSLTEKINANNTDEILKQLEDINEFNAKVDKVTALEGTQTKLNAAIADSEAYTESLNKINQEKKDRIAGAKIPIEGLEFDGDELRVNGVEFSELNKGKLIEYGIKLATFLHKDLKIMKIEDGSLLGGKTFNSIATFAHENNYQLFIEVVDRDRDELVIEYIEEEVNE